MKNTHTGKNKHTRQTMPTHMNPTQHTKCVYVYTRF